jgi:sulfite reductase alpha subunit-like flavoprotein
MAIIADRRKSMDEGVIHFGTETGNAEELAEDLTTSLAEAGIEAEVVDMEDAAPCLLGGGWGSCRTTP